MIDPRGIPVPPDQQPNVPAARQFPLPFDNTYGWTAQNAGPANRSLGHNGGWLPTTDYMAQAYGSPLVVAGDHPSSGDPTTDALDYLGKTSINISPYRSTNVPTPIGTGGVTPPARPVKLFEGLLGGLTGFLTGILPGDLHKNAAQAAANVGNFLDTSTPLGGIPNLDLPGWSREETFDKLADTPEKKRYRQMMESDPMHFQWYLSEYLRTHQQDVANAMHIPGLLAGIFQPDANILEKALGVLNVSGALVGRTIAGGTGRIEQLLADNDLPPELEAAKTRFLRGEWGDPKSQQARDTFLDAIAQQGGEWNKDPFLNMLAEVATDPIILVGGLTGVARMASRVGILARRASAVTGYFAGSADPLLKATYEASRLAEAGTPAQTGLRGLIGGGAPEANRIAERIMRDSNPAVRQAVSKAIETGMSGKDQALLWSAPVLRGAARVSDVLNSPFGFFGHDAIARRVARRWFHGTPNGFINAYGIQNAARLFRGTGDTKRVQRSLGYAFSYLQRQMGQGNAIRFMRGSLKLEDGTMIPLHQLPDSTLNPNKVFDAIGTAENPLFVQEAEMMARQNKEVFTPDIGDVGFNAAGELTDAAGREAAWAQTMKVEREKAALKWTASSGMDIDESRKLFAHANTDELGLADLAFWGRSIDDFIESQKAGMKEVRGAHRALVDAARAKPRNKNLRVQAESSEKLIEREARMTPVGERELTAQRAADLMGELSKPEKEALRAAQAAMNRYEVLRQNFWSSSVQIEPEQFLENMRDWLADGIKREGFVQTIKYENLSQAMKDWVDRTEAGGKRYEVGLAPMQENVWRPVFKKDTNTIIGYHPWMDVRVDPLGFNPPTRLDVARNRLFSSIRSHNILIEARHKFLTTGVRYYGLDRPTAITLYEAIRKAASDRKVNMRGFTQAEFQDIMSHVAMAKHLKVRIGPHGLAELTARALQGDLMMVGLTTRMTGSMKVTTAHYGNFVGVIAERVYPLIRFYLNPVFLMQEWIEPMFFNILRGVKPGFKFARETVEIHQALDQWNMAAVLADGLENRDFLMTGAYRARMGMGPTTRVGRLMGKLPYGRVNEVKQMNYARLTKQLFGENMYEAWQKQFPGRWQDMSDFFHGMERKRGHGDVHLSKGDLAVRYWLHRGLYDSDSASTFIHHYDGAIADDMGRVVGIRISHVAKAMGYDSGVSLRQAVDSGFVDEWDFRESLVSAGFTQEYATRAWDVARGTSPQELYDSVARGFTDPVEAQMASDLVEGLVERMAITKGISSEEYVARKFASQGIWLDSSGRLPYKAYTQLPERILREKGFPRVERTDPFHVGMQERARNMMPTVPHKERNAYVKAGKAVVDPAKKPTAKQVDGVRTVAGIRINPNYDAEAFVEAVSAMGFDEETAHGLARWYDEISPLFAGVAKNMDATTLDAMISVMEEKMPSLGKVSRESDDVARQEVGARMLMAWASTQVRTSPRDGFGYILTLIDEISRGKRRGAKIGLFKDQRSQLTAMLEAYEPNIRVKGVSSKLHDFIDSVLGNRQRSYMLGPAGPDGVRTLERQVIPGPNGTELLMQPAAQDIWMGRSFGYVDTPFINYLAGMLAKQKGLSAADALDQAMRQTGFFARNHVTKTVKGKTKQVWESMADYRARKAAWEQANGMKLKEEWSGSPSKTEYEWMLRRTNEMVHDLNSRDNGTGYLGKGYGQTEQWTAADIQALEWMRIQKSMGIDPGGPTNMFHQNAAQVSFEVLPQMGGPLADAIPMWRASDQAKDLITATVSHYLADSVQEATGVQITRVIPGRGGWRNGPGDFSISPNTFWEVMGSEESVRDALSYIGYMTQQNGVMATRTPLRTAGKMPEFSGVTATSKATGRQRTYNWGIDFVPKDKDPRTLDAMAQYIEKSGFRWNGYMFGSRAGGEHAVRSLFAGPEGGLDQAAGYTVMPARTDLRGFTDAMPIPDELRAKLESGQWALDAGFDDAPIPVRIERDLHEVMSHWNDYEADLKRAEERLAANPRLNRMKVYKQEIGKGTLDDLRSRGRKQLVNTVVPRDLEALGSVWDTALKRYDGEAWAVGRGHSDFLRAYGETSNPHLQQSGPRGWRGATAWTGTRGATERVATGAIGPRAGRLYLKKGEADLTSVVHELFHFFADDLDQSAVNDIHKAWWGSLTRSEKKRAGGTMPTGPAVIREAEEWVAYQYQEWVGTGIAPTGTMNSVFKAFAAHYPTIVGRNAGAVDPALAKLFTSLTPEMHRGAPATFDVDQFRYLEATRIALLRAEDEAFTTHYYRRGRTLMERSINHPYLGMYPASYMWGKVLPELMRFLVKKPFGIDAPFAGMALANHVYNAMQLWLNTDDGSMETFVKEFPEVLRFMSLMLPGTPYDLPVNVPAWARRIAQDTWEGTEPDIGKHIGDTIGYAFGPGRAPADFSKLLGSLGRMAQGVQEMAGGTYRTAEQKKKDEQAARANQRVRGQLGYGPPPPTEQPILEVPQ